MSRYFEGHDQAQKALLTMDIQSLLDMLDGLQGRDRLSDNPTLDELRQEASRQVSDDFRNPEYSDNEQTDFWIRLMEAARNNCC